MDLKVARQRFKVKEGITIEGVAIILVSYLVKLAIGNNKVPFSVLKRLRDLIVKCLINIINIS